MFSVAMSNSTSNLSEEAASISSGTRLHDFGGIFNNNNNNNNPLLSHFSDHNNININNNNNNNNIISIDDQQPQKIKKKRSLPGHPDPDAEVIALSPKTLLATNRFVCEICNKGFQRDQNLQLHRRGHNLPWKLKQRSNKEMIKKRAYVCPEATCVHHHPSRALGDLTGIKKHYSRKHGEKKWKCEKCSKIYAVQSDWKAHSKTCGTREYRCDCGTLFSRKDSFITHRAFCDALAEESARLSAAAAAAAVAAANPNQSLFPNFSTVTTHHHNFTNQPSPIHIWDTTPHQNPNPSTTTQPRHPLLHVIKPENHHFQPPPPPHSQQPLMIFPDSTPQQNPADQPGQKGFNLIGSPFQTLHVSSSQMATSAHLSATALLQKAATVGAVASGAHSCQVQGHGHGQSVGHVTDQLGRVMNGRHHATTNEFILGRGLTSDDLATWRKSDRLTRDFLGLTADTNNNNNNNTGGGDVKDMLTYTGGVEFPPLDQRVHSSLLKPQVFGFAEAAASQSWADC